MIVPSGPDTGAHLGDAPADRRELLARILAGLGVVAAPETEIAIIGVAGRYPLAGTVDQFWRNLRTGRDCVREVPADRWPADAHFDPAGGPGRSYSKWAGFLDDVDKFDPLLFQISPSDAEDLDPQERLFLEIGWAAVEDAGYAPRSLGGNDPVGVFAGVMNNDYEWIGGAAEARGVPTHARSNHWSVANRLSYTLDLHGPSMTVDTACSSSLTAIHLAVQSLNSGESAMAIAGGVNLILHPAHLWHLSDRQMISQGRRNRAFGAGADGFVDGEGVGAVVLKPLAAAVADGDRVLGVIRGSALNAGGRTSGYTVPNPNSQAEVIVEALRRAGVDPAEVGYVEAHGTGTPLGDPLEIAGLRRVFGGLPQGSCVLGSVKSTIGHLESAAGIAALTKVLLQFRHGMIAPSPHAEPLNPEIDLGDTPFRIPPHAEPWPSPVVDGVVRPRVAGVSSFGGGGANAHLVVTEYVDRTADAAPPARTPQLVVLSARTEERLRVAAGRLADFLDDGEHRTPAVDGAAVGTCVAAVAEVLGVEPGDVDPGVELRDYGLGSAEWPRLRHLLADHLKLPATLPAGTTAGTLAGRAARNGAVVPRADVELADIAHTLRVGRSPMDARLALVVADTDALHRALRAVADNQEPTCPHWLGDAGERLRDPGHAGTDTEVRRALADGDLHALGALWAGGCAVDWSRLTDRPEGCRAPRRIALPAYPFARRRFWIPEPARSTPVDRGVEPGDTPGRFAPRWQPAGPVRGAVRPTGPVLVLATEASRDLTAALATAVGDVRVEWLDGVAAPAGLPREVDTVIHLGGVRAGAGTPVADDLTIGAASLFDVLTRVRARALRVVTSDVYPVAGAPGDNPVAAALHGLAQVASAEFPGTGVSCVDLTRQDPIADRIAAILGEPAHPRGRVVVVRGGRRHARALVPVPAGAALRYREGGVYVIVGGTGGIGVELTRHLAERYRATVVWLSRNEPGAGHRAEIERARGLGGDVVHQRVDVADTDAVRAAIAWTVERFGAVHGVFHSAMTFDDRPIGELTGAEFRAALAAKVDGTLAVDAAVSRYRPDFVALFSSAGSFGSSSGNSAYTAASACQDALGRYLDAVRPYPVRVVNWGYWGAVGSGARPSLPAIFRALGIGELSPAEGLAALPGVLAGAEPQVMVIRAEPPALAALADAPAGSGLAAVRDRLDAAPRDRAGTGRVIDAYGELEPLVARGLVVALRRMGAFTRGDRVDRAGIAAELGVVAAHTRHFAALITILVRAGHLVEEGASVRALPSFETTAREWDGARLDAEFDRLRAAYPEVASTILPVQRFLAAYPEVLCGRANATEILFPNASLDLAVGFYQGNPVTDHYNDLVRGAVAERVRARVSELAEGERVSIVELGAGTGATTERVLPVLDADAHLVEYAYTDVSPRFLEHGRHRLGADRPYVRFRILDLRSDAAAQGFVPGGHDVVIATNVVHATPDLVETLRSVRSLLRPGGWFVLNELTTVRASVTVAGGVLDGWWSFRDAELRIPDSPLGEPATWARLLREAGFTEVAVLSGGADLGQTVLVAEAGGEQVPAAVSTRRTRTPATVRTDGVPAELRDLVERTLKLDERIDPDRPLAEYGFDSLTGMQIVTGIAETYGADVRLVDILEHPTLRSLAAHLATTGIVAVERPAAPAEAPLATTGVVAAKWAAVPAEVPPATTGVVAVERPAVPVEVPPAEAGEVERHPVSEGQRALWVIEQTAPGNSAYNLPVALWLDADTDIAALRTALETLVARHPALRTTLVDQDGTPVQVVHPRVELEFSHERVPAAEADALAERLRARVRRPFDLSAGPLVRAEVHTVPDGRHALLITLHHGVFDGTSIAVFLEELTEAYLAVRDRRPVPQPRRAADYRDFVDWQRSMLAGPRGARLREFWLGRLAGAEPVRLPTDRPRRQVPSFDGASTELVLDADLVVAAKRYAATAGVSLFAVVFTAYVAMLDRHCEQRRITVGTPVAGRPEGRFARTVGYFVNLVAISVEPRPEDTFGTLLRRVRAEVLDAVEHGDYPFIRVAEELGGPLVSNAFYFQNWVAERPGPTLVRGLVDGVHQEGEFELTADVVELAAGCKLTMKYDPRLFDRATVDGFAERFRLLLAEGVAEPDRPLAELDPRTPAERELVAREQAASRRDYPSGRTVVDLVAEQARRHPGRTAVVCRGQELTYRELITRVRALAGLLRERGARPGRTVGVLVDRSPDLVVALLGVLASGAAYVPLDPAYPAERVRYMTSDAAVALVVTQRELGEAARAVDAPALWLDPGWAEGAQAVDDAEAAGGEGPSPTEDAYVIYTSGSTGRPKGVRVGHRALVNLLWSMAHEPGFTERDRILAVTTVSFDIAGLELFLPLVAGGSVEVVPAAATRDGIALRRVLEASAATVMQATPATWRMLVAAGWTGGRGLRAFCGGEALDRETARALLARVGEVWNLYGPTETTIWSSVARVRDEGPITLGHPIANTVFHLLDGAGRPVPASVPAELHIGGAGLANGYLGQPELTAARFVPNPVDPEASPLLYRTGDLVRRTAGGALEYLGRIDAQVKIRGHRVEPGEIEQAARELPGVADAAVVLARTGAGAAVLRCFYTPAPGGPRPDRLDLGRLLPDYMVPDELIELPELPKTPNDKIDRARLAAERPERAHRERRAPAAVVKADGAADGLAAELAGVVADLIGAAPDDVDETDRFGVLGVDSVRLTELSVRIRRRWGVEVAPPVFFKYPTARAVADHLLATHPEVFASTTAEPAGTRAEPVPVAARTGETAVIGMAGRLPGSLDLDAFWRHLVAGDDLVTETPIERWDWRALGREHGDRVGRVARWGGYLDGVDRFDAAFFAISPREAELMDPQQRLALEAVWTALEDAGLRPSDLAGSRVGVFLGVSNVEYAQVQRDGGRHHEGHAATGAAQSIVPNRVSYFFDFRGPSVALDTACSSSLTAVAQAVAALRTGACDLAIAGGVNLLLSPEVYLAMADGHVLSEDGRCKTFDSSADGYVRGEGVGVVVLRDRAEAERAGDVIHAVIRGIAINHGGLSSSLTAPNPDAQAALMAEAYTSAGVDPADVDYLEAHGTGTELGDPVEVSGMRAAFEELARRRGTALPAGRFCGIGSVKSNIGHLETAAGIAGLFKVALAMRHGLLPANLHYTDQNPYLELDGGPFRVVDEATPWPRRTDRPRIAGLSSFGVGGANAHLVVEEPPLRDAPEVAVAGPLAFPLSARTATALAEQAGALAAYLDGDGVVVRLVDVAHTLLVGREELAERAVVVAKDRAELVAALRVLAGGGGTDAVLRGRAGKRGRSPGSAPARSDAGPDALLDRARRWVAGDRADLTCADGGRRVPLPTYPFERTRYWVDAVAPAATATRGRLHPTLLDANVSTLEGLAFEKHLTPGEFYLADHVVGGELVLPGVVHLELARLAGELAGQRPVRVVGGLVWGLPVRPGPNGLRLRVRLGERTPDGARFEVVSIGDGPAEAGLVRHASGVLSFGDPAPAPQLDVAAVRGRCVTVRTREECYDRVTALGFDYGPSLRAVEEVRHGADEALATLVLPEPRRADTAEYRFEPALLDGALQVVGWIVDTAAARGADGRSVPYLPFSIDEVRLLGELPDTCLVHAVRVRSGAGVQVFDLTMTDRDGTVVCRVDGFALRARVSADTDEPVAFVPSWRPATDEPVPAPATVVFLGDAGPALVAAVTPATVVTRRPGESVAELVARLADAPAPVSLVQTPPARSDLEGSLDDGFHLARELAAAWVSARRGSARWLYLYDRTGDQPELHGAMAGFARSLSWEYPELAMRVVGHAGLDAATVLAGELTSGGPAEVMVESGGRMVRAWQRVELPEDPEAVTGGPGVHLVTGGAGALGLAFAAWLVERNPEATVVLAGRTEPDPAALDRLRGHGADVRFVRADLATRDGAWSAVDQARRAGELVGVAHLAGTLRDSFLLRKSRAEADAVLRPKVLGAAWLDLATRHDPLRYFVAYSSTAAAFGNVGQADHATASGYLDRLMARRAEQVAAGERCGVSLSVQWPLWTDGGVTADPAVAAKMTELFGMRPVRTRPAMAALARALAGDAPSVLLAPGDADRIAVGLGGIAAAPRPAVRPAEAPPRAVRPAEAPPRADAGDLRGRAEELLAEVLSEQLKMPVAEIDPEEDFHAYGVDSLIVMSATAALEKHFGPLSKTLFFEYLTLAELAQYLVTDHAAVLRAALAGDAETPPGDQPEGNATPGTPATVTTAVAELRQTERTERTERAERADEDIAIIGVAGRYPQADDLWEFWENLRAGRDCVEDVPVDRWEHDRWYDPTPGTPGRTATRTGGFMRDADKFDPMFFRMSPVEARHLDPQERIFLETVWHLLEDAGRTRADLAAVRTGVFVGMMYGHYQLYGVDAALHRSGIATSSSYAAVANRVSYFYGLTGPSIALDTMCSSSLAAIHLACQAIRTGDCEVAIAGGVNITSHPVKYLQLSRSGFLAPSGACRSFGADGDGFVPADGSGAVLLKRLSQAEADGDRILAVVRGSAVNHGGASKGYSVPNPRSQGVLVADALARAGVRPSEIDYIEAHGTGTSLGDPVEISGLSRAFAGDDDLADRIVPIGSVKSNIGHAESAAGIAAVTKVLLQLRHRTLVPSLHAERLNANIDFDSVPFRVQRERADWRARTGPDGRELPRLAGVSAFGAGGSNAHLILQEYVPARRPAPTPRRSHLAVLSARNPERLVEVTRRLADFLDGPGRDTDPAALAYTLQVGREPMPHRLATEFTDVPGLVRALRDHLTAGGAGAPVSTGVADRRRAGETDPAAWVHGATVDWRAAWGAEPPGPVSLPGYPFERDRCWLPEAAEDLSGPRRGVAPVEPVAQDEVVIRGEAVLSMDTPYVAGHRVDGRALMPALAYVDLVYGVFAAHGHAVGTLRMSDLTAVRPLEVTDDAPVRLSVEAVPAEPGGWTVTVADDGGAYATAEMTIERVRLHGALDVPVVRASATRRIPLADVYAADEGVGQVYTGAARAEGEVWECPGALVAELTAPTVDRARTPDFDPAVLLAGAVAPGLLMTDGPGPYLPVHVASFRATGPLPARCFARVDTAAIRRGPELVTLGVEFYDERGGLVAELVGLSSKLVDRPGRPRAVAPTTAGMGASADEALLRAVFAAQVGRDPESLDVRAGYFELGIESAQVLKMVAAVEELVGDKQPPTLLFERTTIRDLAAYLAPRYPHVFDGTSARPAAEPQGWAGGLTPDDADRWVARETLVRLRELGLFADGPEPRAGLAARHGVVEKYHRWVDEALRLLAAAGFTDDADPVALSDAGRRAADPAADPNWVDLRARLAANPYWHAQLSLVEDCVAELPAVLTGTRPVTEILFPGGSLARMMAAYQGNTIADGLNQTVADTVAAFVRNSAGPVRIGEVGAGTGGTTAVVLPALDAVGGTAEYWFTDLSPMFLSRAEERFGLGRDYLRYGRWDVERPGAAEDLAGGTFDVLIASNVLHATRDLRQVVANLAAALRPGGLLVVNEVTRKSALLTLTFGLLDGWWLYHDEHLRIPGAPLLTAAGWQRLLREHGFGAIARPTEHDGAFAEVIVGTAGAPDADRVRLLSEDWQPAPAIASGGGDLGRVAVLTTPATAGIAGHLRRALPGATVLDVDALAGAETTVDTIIDLTGCAPGGDHLDTWLPWLQRACAGAGRVVGVTRGLDRADPHAARVAGLYGMLGHEMGRLRATHVDLDPTEPDATAAGRLLTELRATDAPDRVRHRGGSRLRPVLREHAPAGVPTPVFGPDEVLVVTGGTRGVGLAAARHAVTAWGVRDLLLIGREELPERGGWAERSRRDDALGRKLRGLLDLAATGARIRVAAVPMDGPGAESALAVLLREHGPVGGVLHAAGVVDEDTLSFGRKTVAGVRRVLAPKVGGTEALLRAVAGHPVRFVVLFSSVAAVLPTLAVGQSDYTMANTYLDQLAGRSGDVPVVSVQWPSWDGIGMGAAGTGPAYRAAGLAPLREEEGLRVLDLAVSGAVGPVVLPVVPADDRPIDQLGVLRRDPASPRAVVPSAPPAASPRAVVPSAPPAGDLDEPAVAGWLLDLIAERLEFDRDRLDAHTPVHDYGTDSITLVELTRTASTRLGVELDPSILIEHPTAAGFARWLAGEHPDVVRSEFGPATVPVTGPITVPATEVGAEVGAEAPAAPQVRPAPEARDGDLAVVGLSCRFPGASDASAYWRLLAEGRSAIAPVPEDRWPGEGGGFHAGLLADVDREFDPGYFHIGDADAAAMDPQSLLLLEETLFAWCDAGYRPDEVKGREIGVYIGGRTARLPARESVLASRNPVMLGQNYLAANISRHFDLRGPSVVVDTACSSALVALNLAAQALRAGEIDAAVVGGVTLIEGAAAHQVFDQRGLLSATPEFHAFDRRAGGFVPAEGAGVVVVKPLAAARADGDRIIAVVKGIAVNNDGRTAGPATPNLVTQQAVLSRALAASGHRPEEIGYLEANASGSPVPDLIELKAVRAVYRSTSTAECALGSVKPNIGHPQCAEGIAGFIKVAMMLQRGRRVPYLSAQQPPEHFDLAASPFRFDRTEAEWTGPRVAAINSFGDGGTNAHVVVAAWAGVQGRRTALPRPVLSRRRVESTGVPVGPAPAAGSGAMVTARDRAEPIAVIGMAGRYPGAVDLDEFWANLLGGVDSVVEIPRDRWDRHRYDHVRSASGRPLSSWGGFLDDVAAFDAAFFRISAAEAAVLDPQERLFLQACWAAIEDAGHTPDSLCPPSGPAGRRAGGVFVGAMHKDYPLLGVEHVARGGDPVPLGLSQGQIANRVSFLCDFHGPSVAVDTLCSSSLTAVHLAVRSLRDGECAVAVAGGVNLSLHPAKYIGYGLVNMHSTDGRCRSFGAGGDGYVSADGVGALVLKPLAAAERDGDHVYAVIRGSAVNHGGAASGFSVPNPVAQAAVLTAAFGDAGTDPATIGVLEAHGTGTSLGDPIELRALTTAFGDRVDPGSCSLGSVKSNIGHAEGAAGISGLTKAVLQLHHRTLVPTLHAEPTNPLLDLAGSPFRLQRAAEAWPARPGGPRRAGVSSFGATGANAHVILEEYTGTVAGTEAPGPVVVPLSARTVPALRMIAARLLDRVRGGAADQVAEVTARVARVLGADPADIDPARPWHEYGIGVAEVAALSRSLAELLPSGQPPRLTTAHSSVEVAALLPHRAVGLALADVAYTLQVGRVELAERAAFVVTDLAGLARALGGFLADDRVRVHGTGPTPRALAERWVGGATADWSGQFGTVRPRRISLPTYPFAQDHYWFTDHAGAPGREGAGVIDAVRGGPGPEPHGANGHGANGHDGNGHDGNGHGGNGHGGNGHGGNGHDAVGRGANGHGANGPGAIENGAIENGANGRGANGRGARGAGTRPSPVEPARGMLRVPSWAPRSPAAHTVAGGGRVLVVDSGAGELAEAIAAHHRRAGARVVLVTTGPDTLAVGPRRVVSVADPDAFRAVLADVGGVDRVHLVVGAGDPHARLDTDVQLLALRLIRALSEPADPTRIDCHLTTHDTHGLDGRAANARGAGLTGLAYFLAHQQRFALRNVDVSARDADRTALAAAIVAEPASPVAELTLLRDGVRYRQRFDEVEPPGGAAGLRTGGAYLVIGGAGVVGQAVTRHLHEHYDARVVWMGRRPAGDPAVRAALAAATVGDRTPFYLSADVTDPEQVRAAVAEAKATLGGVNGVVFAGATTITEPARAVAELDDAEFRHHYDVKASGAVHVAVAVVDEPLDFLCFFSSAQAFAFGGVGTHPAYAAGITFADAFARVIGGTAPFPVGVLNWGAWAASFGDSAADHPGVGFLSDEQGAACFDAAVRLLVTGGPAQTIGLRPGGALPAPTRRAETAAPEPVRAPRPAPEPGRTLEPAPADATAGRGTGHADRDRIKALTTQRLARVLRVPVEELSSRMAFAELGVDSITGMSFMAELGEELGLELDAALLYDHTSIDRLTDHLTDLVDNNTGGPR
ncbi:amino acid adenylation domain-containing protein [Micromonospora sp. NPDC002296]|uniref:amino acid adenylation domain-containing protein n=1 Tax=Micromonospora sp. NPDC002296 TaxID=3154271 RepID=UPI00331A6E54